MKVHLKSCLQLSSLGPSQTDFDTERSCITLLAFTSRTCTSFAKVAANDGTIGIRFNILLGSQVRSYCQEALTNQCKSP